MQAEKLFEKMVLIRLFEEQLESLFVKGVLFGTTHSYAGQEAIAVGASSVAEDGDIVTSNHRGHGHYIAFTDDVEGLVAEIMGKENGVCSGRGGSQHLCHDNFYSNGITAGMIPVATGMAFAEKLKETKNIVICFLGDGALGEGVLYESLNMASLWNLPILYVVENNYYAMSTPVSQAIAGNMIDRGKAFGIEAEEITSNDVEEVSLKFKSVIDSVRSNSSPAFLVCNTYRFSGHSKSDNCSYRTREEEEEWKKKDPLAIMEQKLDADFVKKTYEKCEERVNKAIADAEKSDFPSNETIFNNLFKD